MQLYGNFSGDSGVVAFDFESDSITVQFKNDTIYVYDSNRPGPSKVEVMKRLALEGRGLCTYISQHVRKNYARRVL